MKILNSPVNYIFKHMVNTLTKYMSFDPVLNLNKSGFTIDILL